MRGGRRTSAAATTFLVIVALTACSAPPLAAPERPTATPAALPAVVTNEAPAAGAVTVAYPDEPSAFLVPTGTDVAGDDLAALWGLPLVRIDDAGQFRRALVHDWQVLDGDGRPWRVRLDLRTGHWTDGSPVDAADVVATLQRRVTEEPARFGVITNITASDPSTVEVAFERPFASWADLLVEAGTILPSEVVAAGTDGYRDDVPVSGGWFRLVEREPGLRLVFEAHVTGPLGAPGLERVEVLFTPSFETALGLLEDDRVDMLVGYLPLNGVPRATELPEVEAASPLGGTLVSLQFRAGGGLGGVDQAARRRGVAAAVDVTELVEGMLGPNGRPATTPWPGIDLPADPAGGQVAEGQQLVLLFPGGSEVIAFGARAVQRDLTARGMTVDLVGEPAPRFAQVVGEERDVAMVVRRTSRRPSLAPWIEDPAAAVAAGAVTIDAPAAIDGLFDVAETARTAPLFQIGVLHAWRDVAGVRPSSWVGTGFWNAGAWTVGHDG